MSRCICRRSARTSKSSSDTGAGIAPEFLPFVFERFRQADAGSTRHHGGLGLGLGLAIVRHLVEMHGGTVEAASAGEGNGATFTVRLPVSIVHPKVRHEFAEHPRSERIRPLKGLRGLEGVRVVAVDDEPDALSLLRTVLESAGRCVDGLRANRGPYEALHAGFEIHRAKPVDPSELVASVVTLVRRSRVR